MMGLDKNLIKTLLRENLLPEVTTGKSFTAYHGSPKEITNFSDEFVGGKEATDQEGPGIYFTSSIEEARRYGENVYTVTLTPRKLLDMTPSSKKLATLISKMAFMAPEWDVHAQNFDENPRVGVNQFVQSTIDYNDTEKDVAQQIWIDFYKYSPVEFVRNMVKMGIDGILVPKQYDDVTHYIIYNPSIIKV